MKKFLILVLMISMVATMAFAQGAAEEEVDSDVIKIALIIENTIDDKGWCQAMHDGITLAMEQNPGRIEYSYSEKMKPVDAGSAVLQYAGQGYDIIIGHGAQYKNLITEMAAEYPEISFAFGTSSEIVGDNVFSYMPESEETGYLNGLIAGMLTKSNTIGLIGPVDGGDAARYNRGFVLGVQEVNPSANVMVAHTGSFSDFVKATEVAQSQIRSGADILTGSSQQALGGLRAVADYPDDEIWWVGQDLAQIGIPEGYKVLSASSYNYAAVINTLVDKLDAGILGGENIPMNFNNDGFIFKFNEATKSRITPEIEAKVNEALSAFKAQAGHSSVVNWSSVKYN
ncbi:BMP family lipoprotein [Pleomorphochaeta sp. DL1XJH-081]|uniref:BMP family lipoprotein n=1 Tax=Pleomorphochaeta sp. DL1XJH-081 TaxID=3409690 RepID=UPI003BB73F47